ncbi:hypothetical protein C8Q78DRAFT_1072526 [Trametes maxima]|nr:hypothetical protein C8Q78DRAFT_1072526 [Trametes maxima]
MRMPTPMLVTPLAPEIVVEGVAEAVEPLEELSLLGHEIERRYNKPLTRDGERTEAPVAEELMHVRVDPAFKHIDIKQAIEYGVDRFSDSIPLLRKTLADISKIHPVVTVVVLAFEAVIELEITRRENDRRVTVLFVEMKEVMSVITHFKDLKSTDVGRDGIILGTRLRELAESTAEDIKQCANLCDVFLKSKILLRVLKGPLWAERFASCMERFARRKEEYSLALAMHTASTVTKMAVDVDQINAKMDLMSELFTQWMSAGERKLSAQVEKEGGAARVRHDDPALKRLMGSMGAKEPAAGVSLGRPAVEERVKGAQPEVKSVGHKRAQVKGTDSGRDNSFGLDDLKKELREDLDDTIERNFTIFLKKYDFQAQLMSDRIIHAVEAAVAGGTHSRIKNADLQRLWKDMNWTGVVKGRLLVHALREHYSNTEDVTATTLADSDKPKPAMNDKWALEYLNVAWLHPIMEAIDDDTSGYISVSEVNRFMQRLPAELGWSLPHWLAYWAVGWRCATTMYLKEIHGMIKEFHTYLPSVLAINRPPIDAYLKLTPAWTLLQGMDCYDDPMLCERFKGYIDWEEARIKSNLEQFNYRIDAPDTLGLVAGSVRIERYIAPLFCLLMRNDLRKVKAARTFILAQEEFDSSTTSMSIIDVALSQRTSELRETFIQRKLDPTVELQKFASGLLKYFDRSEVTIPGEWWQRTDSQIDVWYSAATAMYYQIEDVDIAGIETLKELPLDTSVYDSVESVTEEDLTSHPLVQAIVGNWNGFLYEPGCYPTRPMTTLFFHAAPPKPPSTEPDDKPVKESYPFVCEGTDYEGSEYIVNGSCTAAEDGRVHVEWCMEYDGDEVLYFDGLILDEWTLSGRQSYDRDRPEDVFLILKKVPAEYLSFRPSPLELNSQPYPFADQVGDVTPEERARAYWRYALNAVQHDLRRKRWTWPYFAERRRVRNLWLDLRSSEAGNLSDEDLREVHLLTTPADARLYNSITEHHNRMVAPYDNWVCDACARPLRLTVVICLQCLSNNYRSVVAFCDNPYCYGSEREGLYSADGSPHLAAHNMVKCRSLVLIPYLPSIQTQAWAGLLRAVEEIEAVEAQQAKESMASVISLVVSSHISYQGQGGNQLDSPSDSSRDGPEQNEEPKDLSEPPPDMPVPEGEGAKLEELPDTLAIPQMPDAAQSRWSLRSLLSNAVPPWTRRTAPETSAADASSTLVESHAARNAPQVVDAVDDGTVKEDAPEVVAPGVVVVAEPPPDDTCIELTGHAETEDEQASPDGISRCDGTEEEAHTDDDAESIYATAPPSFVSEAWSIERPSTWASVPQRRCQCLVCSTPVGMGSWFCIQCNDFVCTDCDSRRLIRCVACDTPFPQPRWYYGMGPLDDFRCDLCMAFRRPGFVLRPPHVHTHTVLLCKRAHLPPPSRPPSPSPFPGAGALDASSRPAPPLVDERLAAMEAQMGAVGARLEGIDGLKDEVAAVGARLDGLEALQRQVAQIHEMMARLLEERGRGGSGS